MLTLTSYSVRIKDGKEIIPGFSYSFQKGNVYCILGKNGSGKSSLVFSLFRHPSYEREGSITLDDKEIGTYTPDALSLAGLFLSFQSIPEIPGIRLIEYLRTVYTTHQSAQNTSHKPLSPFLFHRYIEKECREFHISPDFLERDLYVGFSGGEKRKIELLQVRLLNPQYIFLDEIDAGLDIEALEILIREIQRWRHEGKCIVLITHNFHILDTLSPDEVLCMHEGAIVQSGGPEVIESIRKNGFQE